MNAEPRNAIRPRTWTTAFTQPGKYLVICNLTPHFAFFNMYGWVIVT